jgi:hypothetical protein
MNVKIRPPARMVFSFHPLGWLWDLKLLEIPVVSSEMLTSFAVWTDAKSAFIRIPIADECDVMRKNSLDQSSNMIE